MPFGIGGDLVVRARRQQGVYVFVWLVTRGVGSGHDRVLQPYATTADTSLYAYLATLFYTRGAVLRCLAKWPQPLTDASTQQSKL